MENKNEEIKENITNEINNIDGNIKKRNLNNISRIKIVSKD